MYSRHREEWPRLKSRVKTLLNPTTPIIGCRQSLVLALSNRSAGVSPVKGRNPFHSNVLSARLLCALIKLPIPEAQRQLLQYGKPCSGSFLWAETGAMLKSSVIAHLECRAMISQPLCADTYSKSGAKAHGQEYADPAVFSTFRLLVLAIVTKSERQVQRHALVVNPASVLLRNEAVSRGHYYHQLSMQLADIPILRIRVPKVYSCVVMD
jgi:hypothetical protein